MHLVFVRSSLVELVVLYFSSIIGFSPPASMITDPNDPTFLAGQSLAQAICDQESSKSF